MIPAVAVRLVVILSALLPAAALAIGSLSLSFDRLEWGGGFADGISLQADRPFGRGGEGRLRLRVATLQLADALPPLSAMIECGRWRLSATGVGCGDGLLQLVDQQGRRFEGRFNGEWQAASGRLQAALQLLPPASGEIGVELRIRPGGGVTLDLTLVGVDLGQRPPLLAALPAGWQLAGLLDLNARVALGREGALQGSGHLAWRALSFSSGDALQAGDKLSGELGWQLERSGDSAPWRLELAGPLDRGEIYLDPLFIAIPETGVALQVELIASEGQIELQRAAWRDDSLDLSLAMTLDRGVVGEQAGWRPDRVVVAVERMELPTAWQRYLEPQSGVLPLLATLDTAGRVAGSLHIEGEEVRSFSLTGNQLTVSERSGLFMLDRLDGQLGWGRDQVARRVDLSWQGARYQALGFGASRVQGASVAGRFELAEPFIQPLLDGELMVDSFRFDLPPGATSPRWTLNAILTPITMERLSAALGWPEMGGRLSGVIPNLSYGDGTLSIGGDLLARVFDGEVRLSRFELEGPLDPVSRLRGEVALRSIDLLGLTETFSFGSIEGRLEGEVRGLELVNWQPVAFDARFATPEGDESRHRISQRAVENISALGGSGVTAALSRSFVRFFDQFGYDRLGVSCRLRGGTCVMDGVMAADQGYYLVKGGGLPRIDVIGYQREVDWRELIERLQAAVNASPEVAGGE